MRIGILSQWFDPEPGPAALPGVLARGLALRGHDVRVVTGFPNYPTGRLADGYSIRPRLDETCRGVRIRRTALYPSHDGRAAGRAANYGSFGISSAGLGVPFLRDCDAVWVSNSPVTVLPAMRRLKRWKVPTLLHVLDLWPDNVAASGFTERSPVAGAAGRLLTSMTDATYRAADAVATIAPSVVPLLESRGVPREKLLHIPLWADEETFYPTDSRTKRAQMGAEDGTVVVLYAGSLGWAQGIETLFSALALQPGPDQGLECWIAGSGVAEEQIRRMASDLPAGAPLVRFLGRLDPRDMNQYMAAADVHYVGLRADAASPTTMPSKVQATLACGKPLIAAVGGDLDTLVRTRALGWSVGAGHVQGVASALNSARELGRDGLADKGLTALRTYTDEFSAARGIDRIDCVLHHIARGAA